MALAAWSEQFEADGYFDKTPAANWKVTWHQDLTISVERRHAIRDFGPWSEKDGVAHVQPPVAVLERIVTLRVQLDRCDDAHGPLRVIPGSHKAGRLSPQAIAQWRQQAPEVSCVAARGDVLVMRPLLLHASSAATAPSRRRVLHVEYAGDELPAPLRWFEQCACA